MGKKNYEFTSKEAEYLETRFNGMFIPKNKNRKEKLSGKNSNRKPNK